jgi:hypothetical protein
LQNKTITLQLRKINWGALKIKQKLNKNIFLFLFIFSLVACGGSGSGGEDKAQVVTIVSASRCANDVPPGEPDNCMAEQILDGKYETDQIAIHLFGTSPPAEDDGCPDPVLTLGGPVCVPNYSLSYSVNWINKKSDVTGGGDPKFIGLQAEDFGFVRWRTYDFFNTAVNKGIPLEFGQNRIRITTTNSGLVGNAEITVTRVVDVTPPTVQYVDPEPGGTYGFRIVAYFDEQLDPASVIGAISVFDEDANPIAGTSEFDALRLEASWRPQSALSPASSYTARISGVTDWAPNTMITPYEWSFTTRP